MPVTEYTLPIVGVPFFSQANIKLP